MTKNKGRKPKKKGRKNQGYAACVVAASELLASEVNLIIKGTLK